MQPGAIHRSLRRADFQYSVSVISLITEEIAPRSLSLMFSCAIYVIGNVMVFWQVFRLMPSFGRKGNASEVKSSFILKLFAIYLFIF